MLLLRSALLDANVLFPMALCDTLIRAALADMYRPYWTALILDEVERNLVEHERATAAQAAYRRHHMEAALPHAMVTGHESLIAAMTNDPKDRHVLAAAVHANAHLIVTENLRDFPARACAPFNVDVCTADAFLSELLAVDSATMIRLIREQAADLRRPPQSPEQVLARLARTTPAFAHAAYQLL